MSTILYILFAIIIFGILIAVHELGHFLAARACGVRVLEFALGMGPLLWQKKSRRGAMLSLRALPIGGFCAMEGEDEGSEDPQAFTNAAAWKRLIILFAGAFMNFLLGFLILLLLFSRFAAVPQITDFMEGCPYESAEGLQVGDVFKSINGHRIVLSSDVSEALADNEGNVMQITVLRDGERVVLENFLMPLREYVNEDTGETELKYGFYFGTRGAGLEARLKYSWLQAKEFVSLVWQGLRDLVTGAVGLNQMTGVVGIVDVIAQTGSAAPTTYDAVLNIAYLAAFIAVNLAVMNLLPLPALDGGRIFFLVVTWCLERLLRRRLDPKYEGYVNTAGLLLLMALMVYVMYNDIARILTG